MKIDSLLEQFIIFLEEKGRSNSTIVAYRKDIEQLLDFFEHHPEDITLDIIDDKLLNDYVQYLNNTGQFTLKTISRKINSLKTFFKYLHQEKLIVKDHSAPIKHPELEPQLPRILSPLEYRALRDVARNNMRLYMMVELLLQTGLRIGELSRLKKEHVNHEHNEPHIYIEPYSSNPGRQVELNDIVITALIRYFENHRPTEYDKGYLFSTKTGNPVLIRNIRTAINRAFEKAGIKNATVNDIRNTFIVFQLENGLKLDRVAEIAGHQKATTTERYLQLVETKPSKTIHRIVPL